MEKNIGEVIQINDSWYVKAGSSRTDLQTRVLKNGESFAIFDRFGDIHRIGVGEKGIFHQGTRYLSALEMLLNRRRPMLLNSSVSHDNTLLSIDLTTPDMYSDGQLYLGKGKLHVFRSKLLWNEQYYEHIRVTNYDAQICSVDLSFSVGADYADIFEIRGMKRAAKGEIQRPVWDESMIKLSYIGLDHVFYQTRIQFDPKPQGISASNTFYSFNLHPSESESIYLRISCSRENSTFPGFTFSRAYQECREKSLASRAAFVSVYSSNEQCNEWVERSSADLRLLITETGQGLYPYAGVPWFCTPFGRDGLITALQCLWVYPELARGVLQYLAQNQATDYSPENDAEPGKILHESRKGEMAAMGEIPFARYYGSVDSTPLFLLLAVYYYDRTGDRDFMLELWPHLLAALDWIRDSGDIDGDGFVEYQRKSEQGILQQGWKDSNDSIFHEDGTDVTGPIALCEVQGYVYEAKLKLSGLAAVLGQSALAESLLDEAAHLKKKFHESFWLEDLKTYAIALDGDKRPCRVRSSNAGHALYNAIADEKSAGALVETLLSPNSFSNWGVRTLAMGEARYNPMSYHNGSVWPHDNALIAMGMARYGFKTEASKIFTAMFNTAMSVDLFRLPELFCGFHRRHGQNPTLYPVACSPQAWASGAVFMLLQATLGLTFFHERPQIRFTRPFLPDSLDSVHLSNLKVCNGEVDLVIRRNYNEAGIHVIRKTGDIEIAVIM
ncbi:glycogen debranching N-terminal domain-containing protein [Desulfosediminicola sp.]|uniref:amylo-alpha-1,6-glucosidase n=1 Tax=Desulfosediminicola sp. TaxID=2886825 RepID=UPI003AF264D7